MNCWHRLLIQMESRQRSEHRHFTRFKSHQKLHRSDIGYLQSLFLSEAQVPEKDIDLLVEKGLGHTRYVIDGQLPDRISWLWLGLLGVVIATFVLRAAEVYL